MTTLKDVNEWMKHLEAKIGNGARVSLRPTYFENGLVIQVDWPNDFHCRRDFPMNDIKREHSLYIEKLERHILEHFKHSYEMELYKQAKTK